MEYAETIQMMPTLFIGSDVLGFVLYNYFKLHHGELKVFLVACIEPTVDEEKKRQRGASQERGLNDIAAVRCCDIAVELAPMIYCIWHSHIIHGTGIFNYIWLILWQM